jgi:hypothetical protein
MKTKIVKLVSFPEIKRGNWHIKTSVLQYKQILIVAINKVTDKTIIRYFINDDDAANFIEYIVEQRNYE